MTIRTRSRTQTRTRSLRPEEVEEEEEEEDDLYSYFSKSVSAVKAHADRFEKDYARPALRASQAFFDDRPIAATFIVIFVFLSFLPAVSFIGLSLFAVTSFLIVALTSTVVASATVVLTLLSLLLLTLFVTLISSALLTLTGIALYALASLFSLLRAQGTHGVTLWGEQMSEFLVGTLPVRGQSEGEKAQPYSHSHAARSGMYKGAGEGIGLESSRMGSGRLGSTLGPFDEGFGTPRANAPYRWLNFHSEEGDIDDPDRGLDLDGYLSDAHSSEMGHKARVKREGGGGEDEQENGIRVKRQRLEDADAADSEDDALYVDSAVAQAEGDVELLPAEGDAGDVLG